jgi:hypothetical protein
MSLEQSTSRVAFVVRADRAALEAELAHRFPAASRIDVRDASLREVFVALATTPMTTAPLKAIA